MSEEIDLLEPSSTTNIVDDIKRFRENPVHFVTTLGRHTVGTQWRSYENYIGQPLYYAGLSDNIRQTVLNNAAVQERIDYLVDLRMKKEQSWQLSEAQRLARSAMFHSWLSSVAEKMVGQMVVTFDHKHILQMCYYVVAQLLARTYHQGVHVRSDEIERLKRKALELQKRKMSMVFLPCHKSHVDYICIQFICFRFGISLPAVVAGDNLNFAVVGDILKQVGAMYIRRNAWSQDVIYPGVAQAYIETLLQNGYNFECYVEGTRSRTGKLLPPKFGILKYILHAIISGAIKDTYIVPVSTQYDKVPEAETYATELLGKEKKKETFWSFLESRNMTSLKMGRIDVRFDEPWSLREFAIEQLQKMHLQTSASTALHSDPQADLALHVPPEGQTQILRSLGYKVLRDINNLSEVMPTALVGSVLLTWSGRGISRSRLVSRVKWLIKLIENAGGKVNRASYRDTGLMVDNTIKVLGSSLVGSIAERELLETVYYPNDLFKLSYYRNQIIHLFVEEAIACVALFTQIRLGEKLTMNKEDIVAHTEFLSNLLSGEFVFAQKGLRISLDNTLKRLQEQEVLSKNNSVVQMSPVEYDKGCETFDFYCYLVWPYIDGYWCASVALFLLNKPTKSKVFFKLAQSLAKTLYHEGAITYYEAVNLQMLQMAFQQFASQGLLVRTSREDDDGKTIVEFYMSPDWEPEVGSDGRFLPKGRLYDFSEKIARSRNKPLRDGLTAALTPRLLDLCYNVGISPNL